MRVRHFLTSSLVSYLDPGSRDTHSSPLVTTDATCKAYGVELVVNSKVDLLKEKIPPPGPAQSLPPGLFPSSSTRSQLYFIPSPLTSFLLSAFDPGSLDIQLYNSLPEELLAAIEQERSTILVDLQGHDQVPLALSPHPPLPHRQ